MQGVHDRHIQSLQPMESLHTLRLLRCGHVAGICPLPGLTCLTIVNCFSISEAGVQNMVQAFSNVQIVAFMADVVFSWPHTWSLSQEALVAMTLSRHARVIDLRGVNRVAKSSIQAMQTSLPVTFTWFWCQFSYDFCFQPGQRHSFAHLEVILLSLRAVSSFASSRGRKAWSKAFATHQDQCAHNLHLLNALLFGVLFPTNLVIQQGLFVCQLLPRFLRDRPMTHDGPPNALLSFQAGLLFLKPFKHLSGMFTAD